MCVYGMCILFPYVSICIMSPFAQLRKESHVSPFVFEAKGGNSQVKKVVWIFASWVITAAGI